MSSGFSSIRALASSAVKSAEHLGWDGAVLGFMRAVQNLMAAMPKQMTAASKNNCCMRKNLLFRVLPTVYPKQEEKGSVSQPKNGYKK